MVTCGMCDEMFKCCIVYAGLDESMKCTRVRVMHPRGAGYLDSID